jgi:NTE family protein
MKTVGVALGGGGARGIAHIAVLEALDDMEVKPVAIAGTSIGALIGAAYAAGMTAKEIRRYVLSLAHDRSEMFRRLIAARGRNIVALFSSGGTAAMVDAEKICAQFLPEQVPENFSSLAIPLTVMASDIFQREALALSAGPLRPALAASIALPALMRPVVIDERTLIDGGATNPLPFDQLRGKADIVVAVDISGGRNGGRREIPGPWECLVTTVMVMGYAITSEKLKHTAPELIIRPNVGTFRTLDFMQASAILRAAEPVKQEIKTKLAALLD